MGFMLSESRREFQLLFCSGMRAFKFLLRFLEFIASDSNYFSSSVTVLNFVLGNCQGKRIRDLLESSHEGLC